jgi:hypothetical protein
LISGSRGTPLFGPDPNNPLQRIPQAGSNAFSNLTSGEFQEWQLGLQLSMPFGYRRELSGVRHQQLLLARERAILLDLENEIVHQLGDAIRDIDLNYGLTQTNFQRRLAAEQEVFAVNAAYEVGNVTLDLLLDAQRRRAEAESAYYRSLVDYNRAIMNVHYRKGSLLEYDGVYLAEGPWPAKAYFDALRQARKRDAATYFNYGYTRPDVFSRGPYDQGVAGGHEAVHGAEMIDGSPAPQEAGTPGSEGGLEEVLPAPGEGQELTLPPSEATSRTWHETNVRQASYATDPAAADALVRA